MSKFWKLPLALLVALAMLLLGSGVASADPIEETLGDVIGGGGDPAPPDAPTVADPPAADPPVVDLPLVDPPVVKAPTEPLPVAAVPVPVPEQSARQIPAIQLPGVGDADGSDEDEGDEDTGDEAPALDPEAFGAACEDGLTQAGLPGGDRCAAIAQCFTLLPQPDFEIPDEEMPELQLGLEDLDPAALQDLFDEWVAEFEALFDPTAVSSFLACLGSALTPPSTGGGGTQQPVVGGSSAGPTYYENCDDARARGAAPVYAGQPGYRAGLDSDNDGIGCENSEGTVQLASANGPTTGQLAYTGVPLDPMLTTAAVLLSGGTLLLLAGARRRRS